MKKLFNVIMLLGVFVAAQSFASAQEKTEKAGKGLGKSDAGAAVAKIKAFREGMEKKLVDNKLARKVVPFDGAKIKETIKQKWEKMDAYYDGDKLVRIQLYPHKGISERTEEFYLMDNKLVFVFIQDKGPKHEGKDAGEPGKEFYFQGDKLIQFDDKSGEKEKFAEQEKKMYETRLPYEIDELLEILNSAP